jgi:hypothetical protein
MPAETAIEKLHALKAKHGAEWTDEIDPNEFFEAFFELHAEVKELREQIASGRAGAKVSDIDPERIAKTTGQA